MAGNLLSPDPSDVRGPKDHSKTCPLSILEDIPDEESSAELPEANSTKMESESENEDEKQFLEQWKAHANDEEFKEMREQQRGYRKECEKEVDLEEFMTAGMDDDYSVDDREEDEIGVGFEGRDRILAWMNYEGKAEKEKTNEIADGEEKEFHTNQTGNTTNKASEDIEMSPRTTILQSIEIVEDVLRITLDSVTVTNPKKRKAGEEATRARLKRLRRDQPTSSERQTAPDDTSGKDATASVHGPSGIISSIWRYFQSWR